MVYKFEQAPEEVATLLYDQRFSIEIYEKLQIERKRRLDFFKDKGVQVIVDDAQELVDFGNKVLAILRLLYRGS